MFKKISIENFRGIKSLSVENFSRVNLFFGKNNSGKSTVLESAFLLTGMTNPHLLVLCNEVRGFKGIQDFSLFFHNLDTTHPISIIAEGDSKVFSRQLNMKLSESQTYNQSFDTKNTTRTAGNKPFQTLTLKASCAGTEYNNEFILDDVTETEEHGKIGSIPSYSEPLVCRYVAPGNKNYATNEVNDILKDKQERDISENLSLLDEHITDFVVNRNNVMVDIGLKSRIPLNMMGDGTIKFFNLIVSLHTCKNGILLIDEIDNGLHFSAMKTLWEVVLTLAKKYNVQMFATTHNIDSLKGLAERTDNSEDISFYKVLHTKTDETKILYYPYDDFSAVLENGNEVR